MFFPWIHLWSAWWSSKIHFHYFHNVKSIGPPELEEPRAACFGKNFSVEGCSGLPGLVCSAHPWRRPRNSWGWHSELCAGDRAQLGFAALGGISDFSASGRGSCSSWGSWVSQTLEGFWPGGSWQLRCEWWWSSSVCAGLERRDQHQSCSIAWGELWSWLGNEPCSSQLDNWFISHGRNSNSKALIILF